MGDAIIREEAGGDIDVVDVIRELQAEMQEAAAKLEFERAALLRDQIGELKRDVGMESPDGAGKKRTRRGKVSYGRNG